MAGDAVGVGGTVEGVEDVFQLLGGDGAAVVGDGDGGIFGMDHHGAPVAVFDGVADKVAYGDVQHIGVHLHAEGTVDIKLVGRQLVLEEPFRKVDALCFLRTVACIVDCQQLYDDTVDAVGLFCDAHQCRAIFFGTAVAQQGHVAFATDDGQRVVDFVLCIFDKHFLGLIILVDAVHHTRCPEAADEP